MHSGSDEHRVEGSRSEGESDRANRIPTSPTAHGLPAAQPAASSPAAATTSAAATIPGKEVNSAGSVGLEEKSVSFFLSLYENHGAGVWGIITLTSRPNGVARAQPGESEQFEKGS